MNTVPSFRKVFIDRVTQASVHTSTDYGDAKGRRIGYFIIRADATAIENTTDELRQWGYYPSQVATGPVFALTVQVSRNGQGFGASQAWSFHASEADRDAAVAKYIAGLLKRSAKGA